MNLGRFLFGRKLPSGNYQLGPAMVSLFVISVLAVACSGSTSTPSSAAPSPSPTAAPTVTPQPTSDPAVALAITRISGTLDALESQVATFIKDQGTGDVTRTYADLGVIVALLKDERAWFDSQPPTVKAIPAIRAYGLALVEAEARNASTLELFYTDLSAARPAGESLGRLLVMRETIAALR